MRIPYEKPLAIPAPHVMLAFVWGLEHGVQAATEGASVMLERERAAQRERRERALGKFRRRMRKAASH